jgi:hypothetical protein
VGSNIWIFIRESDLAVVEANFLPRETLYLQGIGVYVDHILEKPGSFYLVPFGYFFWTPITSV